MRNLKFLDTNILLYSISRNPHEAVKRDRAIELLDQADCAVSIQVLQEFYVQATRVSRPDPIPHETAVGLLKSWTRFPVQQLDLAVLTRALEIKGRHRFSYWDSAIISAAMSLGCKTVYSEDLSHGQQIDGLRIVNPFLNEV